MDAIQCFDGDGVHPPHGLESALKALSVRTGSILTDGEARKLVEEIASDPKRRVMLRFAYSTIQSQHENIIGYMRSPKSVLNPDVFLLLEKALLALYEQHPVKQVRPYMKETAEIVMQLHLLIQ